MKTLPGLNKGTERISDFMHENDNFRISFEDKAYERVWQCFYDWGTYRLMELVIKALSSFKEVPDFEKAAKQEVDLWLRTYSGLGLFVNLLPKDVQEFLYRRHRIHEEESERKGESHDYEKTSDKVKAEYEILYDQSFNELIPNCEVHVDELEKHINVDRDFRDKRKKLVFVKICYEEKDIEIRFVLEKKKKLEDKLVDRAAGVVFSMCSKKEVLSSLSIPKTLKDFLLERIQDRVWVNSYYENKQENTDES